MNPVARKSLSLAILVGGILAAAAHSGYAQDAQTERALKMITDTAAQICQTAPLEQTNTGIKLSGDATAKVGGIIGRLADIGVKGAANYQKGHSIGVLQQDLAKAIENSNNCKLEVFRTLSKALLGSSQGGITIPATSVPANSVHASQSGGRLYMSVPGKGNVEISDDDTFLLALTRGDSLFRNFATVNALIEEGRSGTLYRAVDPSGGEFYAWVTYIDLDRGDSCVHFNTLYERFNKEWGLWRACAHKGNRYIEIDPTFVELIGLKSTPLSRPD